jgi:Zn-finger nucleic acid-binding protein/ribosomal protein L40E
VDAEIQRCASCGAPVDPKAERCSYCKSTIVRDKRRLSLICPECYARNPDDSRFCTNCGVEFNPQAVAMEGEKLPCPACSGSLVPRSIGGVRVSECSGCNGLWVPGENFDMLLRRAVEARQDDPMKGLGQRSDTSRASSFPREVVYRNCPVCNGQMQRRNFAKRSGVITDWCGMHGTWLDADELGDIAGFIQRGGLAGDPTGKPSYQPADEKQYKAVVEAHRIMAGEEWKLEMKKRRLQEGQRGLMGSGNLLGSGGLFRSIGDLLESLLGD